MSIEDNYEPLVQQGNGVTAAFADDWRVFNEDYFDVYLESVATGVQTPQVYGVDYTAVFDNNGFIVTFTIPPLALYYVVIGRNIVQNQTDPYKTSQGYQGEVLENALDKLTAIDQDQQDQINRSVKFKVGTSYNGFYTEAPQDGFGLVWDGVNGNVRNTSASLAILEGNAEIVAANIASINTVAGSIAAVVSVSANIGIINTVASSIGSVVVVGNNIASVNTVAANITAVNTAATNIAAIIDAPNQATNANNSAVAAAASAASAANAAAQFTGTSATNVTIGTGTKAFTTQASKAFNGENVRVYSQANITNFMDGLATYSGTSLSVDVVTTGGSGAFTDWVIKVNGARGADGPAGSLNIPALVAKTTAPDPANDLLVMYENSSTSNKKINPGDFLKVLNALTADPTPDSANDYTLTYDASASAVKKVLLANLVGAAGIGGVTNQFFTSSGTYTKTTGTKFIIGIVTPGGGGGGGAVGGAGTNKCAAGAGPAGTSVIFVYDVTALGSQTITVGAGGTGGSGTGGANGGAGGNSSFGSIAIANGTPDVAGPGTGAAAATGKISRGGFSASSGHTIPAGGMAIFGGQGSGGSTDVTGNNAHGGMGGASFWGGGGMGATVNASSMVNAVGDGQGYGAGGGGGASYGTGTSDGGAGKGGIVAIFEFK